MRPGTPEFRRDRLKAAREARGISGAALAELTSVTRSAISQYERGEQTPSPAVLHEIATALNLPARHFCIDLDAISGPVFYRSFASAQKRSRIRAERKLEWLTEIVDNLSTMVEFPSVCVPEIDSADDVLSLSMDEIEDIATATRRAWELGDGPISNVVRLAENNGIISVRQFLDSDRLDAFSYWEHTEKNPLVVLSTDKSCSVRSRFDLAHEIGHLVLHRKINGRQLKNGDQFKQIEAQANRFAGAFLLPATTFLRELFAVNLDAFLAQKERWKTSVALMVKRCVDLGVVDETEGQRLWVNLGRRGWRKREPLDDEISIEEPQFLSRCFELLIANGPESREALLSQMPWSAKEIEELVGLRPATIHRATKQLEEINPRIIRFPNSG